MLPLIQLHDVVLRNPDVQFAQPLNWALQPGEHWAFIGANGAGKTRFVDVLTGKLAVLSGTLEYPWLEAAGLPVSETVRAMAFKDIYSLSGDYEHFSYQQRWHSQEAETSPVVRDLLVEHSDAGYASRLLDLLGVRPLLDKKLIHLSSGELRKFLLVRTLMAAPKVLILDNPFIGLDAASRDLMNQVLESLSNLEGLQLIFVLSNPSDIPAFVNHVLPVSTKTLGRPKNLPDFLADTALLHDLFPAAGREEDTQRANALTNDGAAGRTIKRFTSADFNLVRPETENTLGEVPVVVELRDVTIAYDQRCILKGLNWTIRQGERWALLGPNGAGKSTLLSLVCADNPQSYANDIRLFGRKRGSGESIWDIKRHIGYVSPEMHHYYQKNVPCKDIVGSGLFDTIGLYRQCNEAQLAQCIKWMAVFGIAELAETSFRRVSSGEQRLCLLARAFVKEPALLILDEPLHGLDASNKQRAKRILEAYFADPAKTLIYVTHYLDEIPGCVDRHFNL